MEEVQDRRDISACWTLKPKNRMEAAVNRTGVLAILVVALASSPTFGQFGGAGGGMGGMGGGMGGQGMAAGMQAQGGRFNVAGVADVQRFAEVEMEGGQRLSGKIELRNLVVDGELGRYLIAPFKIKAIRFLKPLNDAKPANGPAATDNEGNRAGDDVIDVQVARQARLAAVRAARAGAGLGGFETSTAPRGKVITITGKEIIGTIHIPNDFRLELEFGMLVLAPDKLRSITFADIRGNDGPGKAGARVPGEPNDAGRPAPARDTSPPRYLRHGNAIIVISPVGDRVTLYSFETKKSESLELSGSKDAPLGVVPILDQNLVALAMNGPKVTRIAVADMASGTWHSQELHKPIDGRAVPIVAAGVVVYNLGQDVYAYSAEAKQWDVALLPEGTRAAPTVGPGTATIESDGHIYTFSGKTGKWNHIDVRALLDGGALAK